MWAYARGARGSLGPPIKGFRYGAKGSSKGRGSSRVLGGGRRVVGAAAGWGREVQGYAEEQVQGQGSSSHSRRGRSKRGRAGAMAGQGRGWGQGWTPPPPLPGPPTPPWTQIS